MRGWATAAAVLSALVALGVTLAGRAVGAPVALLALGAANAAAFVLFGCDKAIARFGPAHGEPGGSRVPERVLLGLAALGGAGAWASMLAFRHKTQKPLFRYGVPALALVGLAAAGLLWWRFPAVAGFRL